MKKKLYLLGVAALIAGLLALSGVAQSAMWVGAELGGNFPLNTNVTVNVPGIGSGTLDNIKLKPSVLGGVTLGYDFVNSGFAGRAWPDWMKYFSFAMDLTYNKLEVNTNAGPLRIPDQKLDGYEVAWTFLFMAHYGFLPDSEVPGGRINPYIGVGPAILFTGFQGNTSTNVALVVEPGIRWVCLPNVSIDTAMRYRYASPSWDVEILNRTCTAKMSPLHQLAFLLRANYHF
jgi:opacity protein-like surface antigen